MSFPQSVAIIKKHEMIAASCVIMAFCSLACLACLVNKTDLPCFPFVFFIVSQCFEAVLALVVNNKGNRAFMSRNCIGLIVAPITRTLGNSNTR